MKDEDKYFSRESSIKSKELDIKSFEGSSPPAVFIGSKLAYPKVNVGILSSPSIDLETWKYNSPSYWSGQGLSIDSILNLRKNLINSRVQTKVAEARTGRKILRTIQEIGMASVQADVDVYLEEKPRGALRFDKENMPLSKSARMKDVRIISNTRIDPKVDKVYGDIDLKSSEAIKYLYSSGFKEQALTQVLSIGVTGLGKNRKFVPTRNSITAVDDLLGKHLLSRIRESKLIENYEVYFGGHLGNYYLLLFVPDVFSYELFEIGINDDGRVKFVGTDYESFDGRKDYAETTAGGYYAARLPILEKLKEEKRQAAVLVLRFVLPEYRVPLGVWVCRNSCRISLKTNPGNFNSLEGALDAIREFVRKNLEIDVNSILNSSVLLRNFRNQTKLNKYF